MNIRALTAEFVGTFTLIFVGVLAIFHLGPGGPLALVGIALAHGLAIACLASATGATSGGHLNPAVSLAMLITGRLSVSDFFGYVIAQLVGATAGAVAVAFLLGETGKASVAGGLPALAANVSVTQGIVAEAITTFLLVFVIFGTAVDGRGPKVGAWFIGMTITLDILAIGPLTGGAINPARWVGPAIISGKFDNAIVWLIGPLLGGALAAVLFQWLLGERNEAPLES